MSFITVDGTNTSNALKTDCSEELQQRSIVATVRCPYRSNYRATGPTTSTPDPETSHSSTCCIHPQCKTPRNDDDGEEQGSERRRPVMFANVVAPGLPTLRRRLQCIPSYRFIVDLSACRIVDTHRLRADARRP